MACPGTTTKIQDLHGIRDLLSWADDRFIRRMFHSELNYIYQDDELRVDALWRRYKTEILDAQT